MPQKISGRSEGGGQTGLVPPSRLGIPKYIYLKITVGIEWPKFQKFFAYGAYRHRRIYIHLSLAHGTKGGVGLKFIFLGM